MRRLDRTKNCRFCFQSQPGAPEGSNKTRGLRESRGRYCFEINKTTTAGGPQMQCSVLISVELDRSTGAVEWEPVIQAAGWEAMRQALAQAVR